MSSNFERWFYNDNGKKDDVTQQPAEKQFNEVVGVKISSLKSLISWLILKKHITNVVQTKDDRPVSLISLPTEQKISILVKNIKNIKGLSVEFNKVFGDIENKKVD